MDAMGDLFAGQPGDVWPLGSVSDVEKRPPGPVFFAIKPSADGVLDTERTARLLRATHGLTGAPCPPELLHVSLLGVGWRPQLPSEVVEAACLAAGAVVMPPFEVEFDRAASFGGKTRYPLVSSAGTVWRASRCCGRR